MGCQRVTQQCGGIRMEGFLLIETVLKSFGKENFYLEGIRFREGIGS